MTRIAKSIRMYTCLLTRRLDEVSVPLVLLRERDQAVVGVMRIVPYPVPREEVPFYTRAQIAGGLLPGRGRSEADMAQQFVAAQTTTLSGSTLTYSGGKLGRIAISRQARGQGCGTILVSAAEQWMISALRAAQRPDGVTHVETKSQLSSQKIALRFYESQNYVTQGATYLEEGQPHIFCVKPLTVYS